MLTDRSVRIRIGGVSNESGRFELERDLVEALRENVARALQLSPRWFDLRAEVTVRTRIADLILIHAATAPDTTPARISYFEAAILAALLERGVAAVDELAERLYSDTAAIQSRADRLARLGLIDVDDDGMLRPSGPAPLGDVRIIAIEAKLARWREAVAQATRYRTFANQSYVALPMPLVERSTAILHECLHAGIGVLAVIPDGTVMVIQEAPEIALQTPEWVRVVSGFVGFRATRKSSRPSGLMREATALVEHSEP